jgi:hypothetical protein
MQTLAIHLTQLNTNTGEENVDGDGNPAMARQLPRVPRLPWSAAVVAIASCCLGRPATAQGPEGALHRVRSSDPSITALIKRASDHSPTFNKLAASIDASNGIVDVEGGVCTGHVAACLPMRMKSSGGNPFYARSSPAPAAFFDRIRAHLDDMTPLELRLRLEL